MVDPPFIPEEAETGPCLCLPADISVWWCLAASPRA